jgi:hypothetical protein
LGPPVLESSGPVILRPFGVLRPLGSFGHWGPSALWSSGPWGPPTLWSSGPWGPPTFGVCRSLGSSVPVVFQPCDFMALKVLWPVRSSGLWGPNVYSESDESSSNKHCSPQGDPPGGIENHHLADACLVPHYVYVTTMMTCKGSAPIVTICLVSHRVQHPGGGG